MMILMNDEYATQTAVELAKILCGSNRDKLFIDVDCANNLADFIETLENRFTGNAVQSDE